FRFGNDGRKGGETEFLKLVRELLRFYLEPVDIIAVELDDQDAFGFALQEKPIFLLFDIAFGSIQDNIVDELNGGWIHFNRFDGGLHRRPYGSKMRDQH